MEKYSLVIIPRVVGNIQGLGETPEVVVRLVGKRKSCTCQSWLSKICMEDQGRISWWKST